MVMRVTRAQLVTQRHSGRAIRHTPWGQGAADGSRPATVETRKGSWGNFLKSRAPLAMWLTGDMANAVWQTDMANRRWMIRL